MLPQGSQELVVEMKEKWRQIKDYPNYAVSNMGRVVNIKTLRDLKHQKSKRGGYYAFVNLYKEGKRKNYLVHLLVAKYFLGPCPVGMEVHHRDTDRMNPRSDNLEYVTQYRW